MRNREYPGNIGLSVYVLTMGFWPTYPTVSALLPPEVKIVDFIKKTFIGRKF
jgi:hypothetical protein